MVRIFDGIAYESEKFSRAIEHSRQNDMKVAASKALNVSGVQIVIAIGIAAIIAAAIQLSTVVVVSAGSF